MRYFLDIAGFSSCIFFAGFLAYLAVFALVRKRLLLFPLTSSASVAYREHPGQFLGWLFLYATVAFFCALEAFEFTKHFAAW